MAERAGGVSALARVEAILANPEIYELGKLVPKPERTAGGRAPTYPAFVLFVWEALISVWGSARQVEAELSHRWVWRRVRQLVKKHSGVKLARQPMRRHHYLYGRNRLTDPALLEAIGELHRRYAAERANEIGLLREDGSGSWTHPDRSRLLYGDGKVVTPLCRAKPGEERVDRRTGEIRTLKAEPDAALHYEGDGEAAWGTKFVLVCARGDAERARMILDLAFVPTAGGEADTAMRCLRRLAPQTPGAQAVVYDTALRGVHHQEILRDLGLLPVNRVTAARAGAKQDRRSAAAHRREKTVYVETKRVGARSVGLYARGGALGVGRLTDAGELDFVALRRVRTHRNAGRDSTFRWYNDYEVPDWLGGGVVTVRLHGNDDDKARKLNRAENVRPISPHDPDFAALFRTRNDAESINRGLEDTMYLRRAHSVGHARQLLNLLGYALMVNSWAVHAHRERERAPTLIAA